MTMLDTAPATAPTSTHIDKPKPTPIASDLAARIALEYNCDYSDARELVLFLKSGVQRCSRSRRPRKIRLRRRHMRRFHYILEQLMRAGVEAQPESLHEIVNRAFTDPTLGQVSLVHTTTWWFFGRCAVDLRRSYVYVAYI